MHDSDAEEKLLRALAEVETANAPNTVPHDETLRAYREGRLSAEEALQVEDLLGSSPQARARLVAMADVALPGPSPAVREAVLASLPTPRRRRAPWWSAAAAAATVVLGLGYCFLPASPLPKDLAFEVHARGAAIERSVTGVATTNTVVEALPDTPLVVTMAPTDAAAADVAFGLYREAAGGLERLSGDDGLSVTVDRGAATLRLDQAARALDTAPGRYPLFVVAARPGDLPARFAVPVGADPLAIAAGDRRRAHRIEVILRHE